MTQIVFKAKDGKLIYVDHTSSTFSFNSENAKSTTYVYSGGRNGNNGIEVGADQLNREKLDFALDYISTHPKTWKVDFSKPEIIVFDNQVVYGVGDRPTDAASAEKLQEAIDSAIGLQIATPR